MHLNVKFCKKLQDDPPLQEDDDTRERRTDDISQWDQEFLKVEQAVLFDLILVRFLVQ